MLTLVGFDVICHKVEWMKIHGSSGNGPPLVQKHTKKNKGIFWFAQIYMFKMGLIHLE
jgi:hypothetical protein